MKEWLLMMWEAGLDRDGGLIVGPVLSQPPWSIGWCISIACDCLGFK